LAFFTPQIATVTDARQRTGQSPDNGDRDALIPAPHDLVAE
jgi:hypothetical protein